MAPSSKIVFRCFLKNTVYDVLKARPGWVETDDDINWDINWGDVGWLREFYEQVQLDDDQRINHFPNHWELTRKDLMVKNLKRMRKQLQRTESSAEASSYSFWNETFVLPKDYGLFVEEFKRSPGGIWIMKPCGRAQGRGIFLFSKLSQVADWKRDHTWKAVNPQPEAYIAQRYIENPYLIGGKKFDLRLYVLVTSFSPLVVWLYSGGFARFSALRYCGDRTELEQLEMHLTNTSIQRKAANGSGSREEGGKWDLRSLKVFLEMKHGRRAVDELFYDIQCVVTRSLLSVQASIIQDKHCFELYGYDVLIDQQLKPWLLEVNASPSLTADSAADYNLKQQLISDVLDVLDLEHVREGSETRIGDFQLIWEGGPANTRAAGHSTLLGCARRHAGKGDRAAS